MKKLALLAVSAALAAPVVTGASPAAVARPKPTVILHYLDIQTSFAATISQNQRPKLGDRFWFRDDFYKWHGTNRGAHIGYADGTLVYLEHGIVEISAVGYFPGGNLDVAGEVSFNSRTTTLAVIGGTGAYATARGELTIRTIGNIENSNKSAQTLRLWM